MRERRANISPRFSTRLHHPRSHHIPTAPAQFSMICADQAAYSAYDADPAHVAFVETRWQVEVDSFQEYDFVARVPQQG